MSMAWSSGLTAVGSGFAETSAIDVIHQSPQVQAEVVVVVAGVVVGYRLLPRGLQVSIVLLEMSSLCVLCSRFNGCAVLVCV